MIEQLPLAAVATGWTTGAFAENEWENAAFSPQCWI